MDSLDHIEHPVIVYDGDCPLCRALVGSILKRDRGARFRFAAAQSPAGQAIQARRGADAIGEGTLLYIDSDRVLKRSDALLEIARGLGGSARLLAAARILPKRWRDWIYSLIARHRQSLFRRGASAGELETSYPDRFLHNDEEPH